MTPPELLEMRSKRLREIAKKLAKANRVPLNLVLGRDRDPQVVRVRHQVWKIAHDEGMSTPAIGLAAGRDPSAIWYGISRASGGARTLRKTMKEKTMKIPAEYMQTSIDNWVNYGCPAPIEMGSFFRSILTHDLMAAAMFADDHNRPRLAEWAMYLHNEVPALAHGSAERLNAWHARGGLLGRLPVEGAAE